MYLGYEKEVRRKEALERAKLCEARRAVSTRARSRMAAKRYWRRSSVPGPAMWGRCRAHKKLLEKRWWVWIGA
jgi:hypothetical protein